MNVSRRSRPSSLSFSHDKLLLDPIDALRSSNFARQRMPSICCCSCSCNFNIIGCSPRSSQSYILDNGGLGGHVSAMAAKYSTAGSGILPFSLTKTDSVRDIVTQGRGDEVSYQQCSSRTMKDGRHKCKVARWCRQNYRTPGYPSHIRLLMQFLIIYLFKKHRRAQHEQE